MTRPIQAFVKLEASSGILLLLCAVSALIWANLHEASYLAVLDYRLLLGVGDAAARFTLLELINDGLMTVFFFVVGMEIKRELAIGELNTRAKASLPAIAALGGMIVPATVFFAINRNGPGSVGWGIPMATDIAFCVGLLTLFSKRIPRALIVFVTALAIIDDIGGILVIAIFYGDTLHLDWLLVSAVLAVAGIVMGRRQVSELVPYLLVGAGLWYALHHAGIHATMAGVVTGLAIPARARRTPREVLQELSLHAQALIHAPADEEIDAAQLLLIEEKLEDLEAPLNRLVHLLHPVVAFGIMPMFALANSGVAVKTELLPVLAAPVTLGTGLGLLLGKPVGIFGATWAAVKLGLAPMPGRCSRTQLLGIAIIAGVGFTVALFIARLAFSGAPALHEQAKIGILLGSASAGLAGALVLSLQPRAVSQSSIFNDARPPAREHSSL